MQASAPAYGTLGRVDRSLFDALFPNGRVRHRVIASVFCIALIFVCAKARFYLPENPTPITLQTFGVLLTGGVMGWRWGMGAVLGYIALGALGLPMFASSDPWALRTPLEAWNASITGVTGGYIIGFLVAAGVTGFLSQIVFTHSGSLWPVALLKAMQDAIIGFTHSGSLWAVALGGLLLYVPALIWLSVFDFCRWTESGTYVCWPADGRLFIDGMYVFMPGDIVKMLAAAGVITALWDRGDRIIAFVRRLGDRIIAFVRRLGDRIIAFVRRLLPSPSNRADKSIGD